MRNLIEWLRIEWLGTGVAHKACADEVEKLSADLSAAKESVRALQRRIYIFSLAYPDLFRLYFTKKGEEQRKMAEEYRKKAVSISTRFRKTTKVDSANA